VLVDDRGVDELLDALLEDLEVVTAVDEEVFEYELDVTPLLLVLEDDNLRLEDDCWRLEDDSLRLDDEDVLTSLVLDEEVAGMRQVLTVVRDG